MLRKNEKLAVVSRMGLAGLSGMLAILLVLSVSAVSHHLHRSEGTNQAPAAVIEPELQPDVAVCC